MTIRKPEQCCIPDCYKIAVWWDYMDNPLCDEHMEQDMDETKKSPDEYVKISEAKFEF